MSDQTTIEILRESITAWIERAEAALQQAAHERREAIAFSQRFEDTSASLPMVQCPICGGTMVDTAPLQAFGDELRVKWRYLFQGERFTLHCLACSTYHTDTPRESARRWEAGTGLCGARSSRQLFSEHFRTWP